MVLKLLTWLDCLNNKEWADAVSASYLGIHSLHKLMVLKLLTWFNCLWCKERTETECVASGWNANPNKLHSPVRYVFWRVVLIAGCGQDDLSTEGAQSCVYHGGFGEITGS